MKSQTYRWQAIPGTIGPWWALTRLSGSVATQNLVAGWSSQAMVQPDMDGKSWYWSVSMRRKGEKDRKAFGRELDADAGKVSAETALGQMRGVSPHPFE